MVLYLKIFFVYLLSAVREGLSTPARNSDSHLKLSEYNKDEVHGCYHHNTTLKLCFNIGSGFMKLSSTNGSILVSAVRDLRGGLSLFQILDGRFMHGFPSSLVALPMSMQASSDELLVDLYRADNYMLFTAGYQQLLKAKLRKLSDAPELLLLELLSAALGRQPHQIEALPQFHFMSHVLLKSMDMQRSPEFRVVPDLRKHSGRTKRCSDLQTDPNGKECLGMCGPGCSCWSWICGDCCLHNGCQQHDTCCRVGGMLSARCFLAIFYGFSCSRYGGYPDCL